MAEQPQLRRHRMLELNNTQDFFIYSLYTSNLSCFIFLVGPVPDKIKQQTLFLGKVSISAWLVVPLESKVHLNHSGLCCLLLASSSTVI